MIPIDTLKVAVKKAGLRMQEQAAFWKVATGECAIYIAKTQKVSRVDLSGFSIRHGACIRLSEKEAHEAKLGHVRGQLDFSKSEDRVLEAFSTALAEMKRLARGGEKAKRPVRRVQPSEAKPAPQPSAQA